jgi:hypothetical protein
MEDMNNMLGLLGVSAPQQLSLDSVQGKAPPRSFPSSVLASSLLHHHTFFLSNQTYMCIYKS